MAQEAHAGLCLQSASCAAVQTVCSEATRVQNLAISGAWRSTDRSFAVSPIGVNKGREAGQGPAGCVEPLPRWTNSLALSLPPACAEVSIKVMVETCKRKNGATRERS